MSNLFLSHSSKDNDIAEIIRTNLEESGYKSLFLDFDPEKGIPAGKLWAREIYFSLKSCRALIAIFTENYDQSRWCFAESIIADMEGKNIFLLNYTGEESKIKPPNVLNSYQQINCNPNVEDGFERLLIGLKKAQIFPNQNERPLDEKTPPYKGLNSYEIEDADIFFGRDEEIAELVQDLERKSRTDWVFIAGASGSGKSSLLKAGILPKLKNEDKFKIIGPILPELKNPIKQLRVAFSNGFDELSPDFKFENLSDNLTSYKDSQVTIVIVVDQFEELLGNKKNAPTQDFLLLLKEVVKNSGLQIMVLATIRTDTINFLQDEFQKEISYNINHIGRLNLADLKNIIENPAKLARVRYEEGLVEKICQDFLNKGALPLLSFTLLKLFLECKGENNFIKISDYNENFSGEEGAIGKTIKSIMSSEIFEDDKANKLSKVILNMVELVNPQFERGIGEEKWHQIPVPYSWDKIPPELHAFFNKFEEERLIVRNLQNNTIRITHQFVFDAWQEAQKLISEKKEFLLLLPELKNLNEKWVENGMISDFLPKGKQLDIFEKKLKHTHHLLDKNIQKFIDESIDERARLEARKKKERIAYVFGAFLLLVAAIISLIYFTKNKALEKVSDADAMFNAGLNLQKSDPNLALLKMEESMDIYPLKTKYELYSKFFRENLIFDSIRNHLPNSIKLLELNHSGSMLALAKKNVPEVFLYDLTGKHPKMIRTFKQPRSDILSLTFSKNDSILLAGSTDRNVHLCYLFEKDPDTLFEKPPISNDHTDVVSISNDNKTIAVGRGEILSIFHKSDKKKIRDFNFVDDVDHLTFGWNGTSIWIGAEEKNLYFLDDFNNDPTIIHTDNTPILTIKPWSDSKIIHVTESAVYLWEIINGVPSKTDVFKAKKYNTFKNAYISPDDRWLLTTTKNHTILLWDLINNKLKYTLYGHQEEIKHVYFHPRDTSFYSTSDSIFFHWKLPHDFPVDTLFSGETYINALDVSKNNQVIVSTNGMGKAQARKLEDRSDIQNYHGFLSRNINNIQFSDSGEQLFASDEDGNLYNWLKSGRAVKTVLSYEDKINDIDLRDEVLMIGRQSEVYLDYLKNNDSIPKEINGHSSRVLSVDIASNANLAISGDANGIINIWTFPEFEPIERLEQKDGEVRALKFFSNDSIILSLDEHSNLYYWNINDPSLNETRKIVEGGDVWFLEIDPKNRFYITASRNKIDLWHKDGFQLRSYDNLSSEIQSLTIDSKGEYIYIGDRSGVISIWKIDRLPDRLLNKS